MTTPERASGWAHMALAILERGGPVAALVLGICASLLVYAMYKELARVQEVSHTFFEKLELCYQEQLKMARSCYERRSHDELQDP